MTTGDTLPTTSNSKKVTLRRDQGRTITLTMPLKAGCYEHLCHNEQFEVANFIRLKSQRSENTQRAYVTQLEKFLIWMQVTGVSVIDEWALLDYQQVLMDPPVTLQNHCLVTFNPNSEETTDHYLDIIRGFVRHLHDKNLLPYNPALMVKSLSVRNKSALDVARHFSDLQWDAMLDTLTTLPAKTPGQRNRKERLRFCILFQYAMGLRINEMAHHSHQAIKPSQNDWRLHIIGKGRRARNLTLDAVAMETLWRYRSFLKLPEQPQREPLPLLPAVRPVIIKTRGPHAGCHINAQAVTPSNWQRLFKQFIEKDVMGNLYDNITMRTIAYEDEWQHFSPHALRHTRITHLVEREKKELLYVQKFAGHENLNTTGNYFHVKI
ncbi:MAG: tyrosine-type recombinase/integrase [Thiohalomonadales bacterium]